MAAAPNKSQSPAEVWERLRRLGRRPATVATLIDLYQSDRELFFRLANSGVGDDAEAWAVGLGKFAASVRAAVSRGDMTPALPLGDASEDALLAFMRTLVGPALANRGGKDYIGERATQDEVAFYLGDENMWADDEARVMARMRERPTVLRLDDADRKEIEAGMPAYVVHNLKHTATKLVQVATVMYPGLRRDGRLSDGRAYCGRVRYMYDNTGKRTEAPTGMVYAVYVDPDGFVFDWDWVREDPAHGGYPLDPEVRFLGNPVSPVSETVLIGVDDLTPRTFKKTKATHSPRGDCVFCYFSDELAFAERINNDLTVFYELRDQTRPTGFKIKNIDRMMRDGDVVILKDAPELEVIVHSFLLYSIRKHPEDIKIYNVLIQATWERTHQPPKVKVQRPDQTAIAEQV